MDDRRDALFKDLESVAAACGLASTGLNPLVEGVYRNADLPKEDTSIEFFSYEPVSDEARSCVRSFKGVSDYRFEVVEFDRDLHGDD